jgi:hypothetical protein
MRCVLLTAILPNKPGVFCKIRSAALYSMQAGNADTTYTSKLIGAGCPCIWNNASMRAEAHLC